jgi:hypothetical protein
MPIFRAIEEGRAEPSTVLNEMPDISKSVEYASEVFNFIEKF